MLLEKTLIRIGNKEYARANKSFGLTTLLDQHVRVKGSFVRFQFRAKSGVMQTIELDDATLARDRQAVPQDARRQRSFNMWTEDGKRQCIDSVAVNAYLREITGRTFTAKNFRTWAGTLLAGEGRVRSAGVLVGGGVQAEYRARGRLGGGEAGQHTRGLPEIATFIPPCSMDTEPARPL